MVNLNSLLKPCWGSEKWILEGWNKITAAEQKDISLRIDRLFKNGLPFKIKHDKLLYIYAFSFMAQLEVLGIQLPMRFEDNMQDPELKQRMRAQLVDEIFHAIAFTKIIFLLCAPYDSPPAYNQRIEDLCHYIRSQECIKVGMVFLNLVCEGLVEEVFTIFYTYDIAAELFQIVMEDEHRHVCEADLYAEIGLPERSVLLSKLKELEQLIIDAFTLEPKYTIALNALIGPEGIAELMLSVHEKQSRQLKKLGIDANERWDFFFKVGAEHYADLHRMPKKLKNEYDEAVSEVAMSATRKVLMTEMTDTGDPTMVVRFNIDITDSGFFEHKYPAETVTALMMQALSSVMMSHDSLRNFLSYNKLWQSSGAYVSIAEKLPDCGDHVGTIHFYNCHEIPTEQLLGHIKRSQQMMTYCYKKCLDIEKEHPDVKQSLDELLYSYAHDVYPCPSPGSHSALLTNIGTYGYTDATAPLLKHTGLHLVLLAMERKSVWHHATQSFVVKDFLPVSISADCRVFDGFIPMPELLNQAFQGALAKMEQSGQHPTAESTPELNDYQKKIEQLADELLAKSDSPVRRKIIEAMVKSAIHKKKQELSEEDQVYLAKLGEYDDFKHMADNLLLDYLKFNSAEAEKKANFTKLIERMLAENLELGYRWLAGLQHAWFDYVDIEAAYATIYKKAAFQKLSRLADAIPKVLCRT